MEKPKVYFGSIQHGRDALFASLGMKFTKILDLLDFTTIKKGDKVAIKMHLGFNEGYQTIPVFFIRRLVKAVKKVGGIPFITDNPTAVYNAVERGYTQETCGCPIVVDILLQGQNWFWSVCLPRTNLKQHHRSLPPALSD